MQHKVQVVAVDRQVERVAAVLVAKKQISLFQQNRRQLTEPRIDRNMKGCLAISVLNEQGIRHISIARAIAPVVCLFANSSQVACVTAIIPVVLHSFFNKSLKMVIYL